ncbi:LEA type 2 family protein [Thermococcus sp. JCM 11816]|uniref:LEA type 2 family protein n=1 Tax=Thermococcus sp. (strain JCM 11816 / KS-1) TaxID=1295125 RepID=UPI0006D26133
MTIYNPQQIPFVLSNIGYEVYMNDILMGEGTLDETVVLKPRASTDVLLSSFIDNTKLGEWWYTHLKNGEKSTVLIKLYWVFDVGGTEIKVPLPMDMKSEIKTDILGGS